MDKPGHEGLSYYLDQDCDLTEAKKPGLLTPGFLFNAGLCNTLKRHPRFFASYMHIAYYFFSAKFQP